MNLRGTLLPTALSRARNEKPPNDQLTASEAVEEAGKRKVVKRKTGMNSPVILRKDLAKLLGSDMMIRSQVVLELSNYIKRNNLQLESNRRMFICNPTLAKIFGMDGEFLFLQLHKLVKPLLTPPKGPEYEARARDVYQVYLDQNDAVDSAEERSKRKTKMGHAAQVQKRLQEQGLGMYADVMLQPCLQAVCGGVERMSRPQILKAVWKYIKENNLQKPDCKRTIMVNEGLREGLRITDKDSLDSFQLSRYIWSLTEPIPK